MSAIHADEGPWIAGLDPASRPLNAPTISTVQHSAVWRTQALYGISAPIPKSLDFLNDQGNWYTPFSRPGMVGPYDIRGWHSQR
jgi:hypothetical protein